MVAITFFRIETPRWGVRSLTAGETKFSKSKRENKETTRALPVTLKFAQCGDLGWPQDKNEVRLDE